METLLALLTGVLFAAGFYCLLRRNLMKLMIGIMLISQGANLLVFTSGGLQRERPAFVDPETGLPPLVHADPVPQALVLTAIVIGFGLMVFSLALLLRAYRAVGTDDLNAFNRTDRLS